MKLVGTPRDDFEEAVYKEIEHGEFSVQCVGSPFGNCTFAYTVGLAAVGGFGELLVAGLNINRILDFLVALGDDLKTRIKYKPGDLARIDSVFESPLHITLGKIHAAQKMHLANSCWLYGGRSFPAWQVFVPDNLSYSYPWDEEYQGPPQAIFSRKIVTEYPQLYVNTCKQIVYNFDHVLFGSTRLREVNVVFEDSFDGEKARFFRTFESVANIHIGNNYRRIFEEGPVSTRFLLSEIPELVDVLEIPVGYVAFRKNRDDLWTLHPFL